MFASQKTNWPKHTYFALFYEFCPSPSMCIYVYLCIYAHMEFWRLEAEVSKGFAQLPLRLHHLGQLIGQRLSQLDYMLVFSLVVTKELDLSLQLHVHSPGAPTQLL